MEGNRIEPKSRWCPMARVAVTADGSEYSANRFPGGVEWNIEWSNVRCLGTACAVFVGDDTAGRCGLVRD